MGLKPNHEFEDLNTYLYRTIKEMIWKKELKPEEKIKQEELAQRLGVSRTPLLKVLHRLTSENLIEYIPRRGFFVKRLTYEELLDVLELRKAIEAICVRKICTRASEEQIAKLRKLFDELKPEWKMEDWTDERIERFIKADQSFHTGIVEIANNDLINQINEMFNIYRLSYQDGILRHPCETLPEHLSIIDAMEERNERKAQNLMLEHMEKGNENIKVIISEMKKYK